ncbi:MAG: hypothetical protein ACC700_18105 [Anaerolineales bacterium]
MSKEVDFSLAFDGPFTGKMRIEDGGGNGELPPDPPPAGDIGVPFLTPILWKEKSASAATHPKIGNGDLTGVASVIGKLVRLDVFIGMGGSTNYGPGTQYWYLQPKDLMPDFDASIAVVPVGSVRAWDGKDLKVGGQCWWSKVGGQLTWGLRCIFQDNKGFSRNNPFTWGSGDTLNLSIAYYLP